MAIASTTGAILAVRHRTDARGCGVVIRFDVEVELKQFPTFPNYE